VHTAIHNFFIHRETVATQKHSDTSIFTITITAGRDRGRGFLSRNDESLVVVHCMLCIAEQTWRVLMLIWCDAKSQTPLQLQRPLRNVTALLLAGDCLGPVRLIGRSSMT